MERSRVHFDKAPYDDVTFHGFEEDPGERKAMNQMRPIFYYFWTGNQNMSIFMLKDGFISKI